MAQCYMMFSPFLTADDDVDTVIEQSPDPDTNDHTDPESDLEDIDFDDTDEY